MTRVCTPKAAIRYTPEILRALRAKKAETGKPMSHIVREILAKELLQDV